MAQRFLGFLRGFAASLEPALVNGEPGALVLHGKQVLAVIAFADRDGAIVQIHAIANPEKLRAVAASRKLVLWADQRPIGNRAGRMARTPKHE